MAGEPVSSRNARVLQWTKGHVPFTQARKDFKAAKATEKAKPQADATAAAVGTAVDKVLEKHGKKKDDEGEEQTGRRQGSRQNIDIKSVQGGDTTILKNRLLDSIRKRHTRTTKKAVSDSLMRDVFCNPNFIAAIRDRAIGNVAIATPLERLDEEYEKDMAKRRAMLVSELSLASQNPRHLVGAPNTHDLDIIFTTMLGDTRLWDDMDPEQWSPDGKPKPPQAFFMFLERVAQEERHGEMQRGRFIGNVLKDLSVRRTFTKSPKEPVQTLVDTDYIDIYLDEESAPPIEWAAEAFNTLVLEMMETKSDQMHPVLLMSGLGYRERYQANLAPKEQKVADVKIEVEEAGKMVQGAEQAVNDLRQAHGDAVTALENARTVETDAAGKLAMAQQAKADAETKGSVSLQGGKLVLNKGDKRLDDLVKSAKDATRNARTAVQEAETTAQESQEQLGEAEQNLVDAIGARNALEREFNSLENDLLKYMGEAAPEKVAERLTGAFRNQMLNAGNDMSPEKIGSSIADQLRNDVITEIARQATEIVVARQKFEDLLITGEIIRGVSREGRGKNRKNASKEVLGEKVEKFEKKLEEFKAAVEAAPLHESVKNEFRDVAVTLGNLDFATQARPRTVKDVREASEMAKNIAGEQRGYATKTITEMNETHGQPLRKITMLSLEKTRRRKEEIPTVLTYDEKVHARAVYEEQSTDTEDPVGKEIGNWGKLKNWFLNTFVNSATYLRLGRWIKWHAVGKQLDHLTKGNRNQPLTWEEKDKDTGKLYVHESKMKRWQAGVIWLVLKLYIAAPFIGGYIASHEEAKWYNPFSWGAPVTRALGGPPYIKDWHFYEPWTWASNLESQRETRRYISDSYDIVWKLQERGREYYMPAFGLGKVLEGEENDMSTWPDKKDDGTKIAGTGSLCPVLHCDKATDRLNWTQGNLDVLKFMQEYTTQKRFITMKDIGNAKANCSTTKFPVPKSCSDPDGLNLKTWDDVKNYPLIARGKEGWEPKMGVCCTTDLTLEAKTDGLVLNRQESDRFVKRLMELEARGKKITYEFLTDPANMREWITKAYLITKSDALVMNTTGVVVRDHVAFLSTQGLERISKFLKMCGKRGEEEWFVKEGMRDDFVDIWMAEIAKTQTSLDLTITYLSGKSLQDSLDSAIKTAGAGKKLLENTEVEHQRMLVADEVKFLNITAPDALDVVAANPELKDFLVKFKDPELEYHVNMSFADEFVLEIADHIRKGHKVSDFDPFGETPGYMAAWAVSRTYLTLAEDATGMQGALLPLKLSDDGKKFYESDASVVLAGTMDTLLNTTRTETRGDGKLTAVAQQATDKLEKIFNKDTKAMDESLKESIYRELSANKDDPKAFTDRTGLVLTRDDQGKLVSADVKDSKKAEMELRRIMSTNLRRLRAPPSPEEQAAGDTDAGVPCEGEGCEGTDS